VVYIVNSKKPINSSILKKDIDLKNLLIIRAPQATNFLADESQSKN